MKINKVTQAFKVADILPRDDTSSHIIKMFWYEEKNGYSIPLKVLKDNSGRVYLIVVNGVIYKIGGSICAGGIKGTWSAYCGCGMTGSPSKRTHGIPILIRKELDIGNKVELYIITSENVDAPVKGLFDEEVQNVGIDFTAIEKKCKKDYKKLEGTFPIWNFQENNKSWPHYIQESWAKVNTKTLANSKRNK